MLFVGSRDQENLLSKERAPLGANILPPSHREMESTGRHQVLLCHPLLVAEDAHWKGWALQGMLLVRDAPGPLHASPEEGTTPHLPQEPPSCRPRASAVGWASQRLQRQEEQRGRGLEPRKSGHVFFLWTNSLFSEKFSCGSASAICEALPNVVKSFSQE